jgi:hypothetical protein
MVLMFFFVSCTQCLRYFFAGSIAITCSTAQIRYDTIGILKEMVISLFVKKNSVNIYCHISFRSQFITNAPPIIISEAFTQIRNSHRMDYESLVHNTT